MARMRYLWRAASATPLPWSSTLARWVWAGAKGPYLVFACRLEREETLQFVRHKVGRCNLQKMAMLLKEGGKWM
eukprot:scaffold321909_cov15-Tisochrysis_lutea.AAC.1